MVERTGYWAIKAFGKYYKKDISKVETALFLIVPPTVKEGEAERNGTDIKEEDGTIILHQLDNATNDRKVDLKELNELYKWTECIVPLKGEFYKIDKLIKGGTEWARIHVKVVVDIYIPRNENGDPVEEKNENEKMVVRYKLKYYELNEYETNVKTPNYWDIKEILVSDWVGLRPRLWYIDDAAYDNDGCRWCEDADRFPKGDPEEKEGEGPDHLQLKYKLKF